VVPLIGDVDRFSARSVAVKVSSQLAVPRRPRPDHPCRRQSSRAGCQARGGAGRFCRHLPVALSAGPFGVVRSHCPRRAARIARSLHDRRSGPALAARRTRSDDIEDIIPVYVLPPAGAATAQPTVTRRVKHSKAQKVQSCYPCATRRSK